MRPRLGWSGRLPWGLQTHLWCSKNTSNPWLGSNLALFGLSYEDKGHPRPACSHHSAQKHANLSFPFGKTDSSEARHSSFTIPFAEESGGTVDSLLSCSTHLGFQVHFACFKNALNSRLGSNQALFEPSCEDKRLPRPPCSHHFRQNVPFYEDK